MSMCSICMRNSLCNECKVRNARQMCTQVGFAEVTKSLPDRKVWTVVRVARGVGISDGEIERLMGRSIPEH